MPLGITLPDGAADAAKRTPNWTHRSTQLHSMMGAVAQSMAQGNEGSQRAYHHKAGSNVAVNDFPGINLGITATFLSWVGLISQHGLHGQELWILISKDDHSKASPCGAGATGRELRVLPQQCLLQPHMSRPSP